MTDEITQVLVTSRIENGACIATLNRPEKLNALSWATIDALLAILHSAEENPDVHAVIIRGEGRAFCTGFDLSEVAGTGDTQLPPQEDMRSFQRAAANWRALWQLRKPVIVAVHGYCLAAGLEMVLHSDFTIAADNALFGYPAVLASGLPDTQMFVYQIGPQWTKRILLTGESLDAETAEKIGLVLKTVPAERLMNEAKALAAAIGKVPLPILEAGKTVVNHAVELMGYTALQRENWNQSALARANPDIAEFDNIARTQGFKAAMAWRDSKKSN